MNFATSGCTNVQLSELPGNPESITTAGVLPPVEEMCSRWPPTSTNRPGGGNLRASLALPIFCKTRPTSTRSVTTTANPTTSPKKSPMAHQSIPESVNLAENEAECVACSSAKCDAFSAESESHISCKIRDRPLIQNRKQCSSGR